MANIIHTEQVMEGKYAKWASEPDYVEPVWTDAEGVPDPSYEFIGWKYNGEIKKPPYSETDFGPIFSPTDILALWSRIRVFCIPDKTSIGYEGGQVRIMYYAVNSEVVTSSDVEKQLIPPRVNPIQYSVVSDVEVAGQYRMCTINIERNTSNEGKKLLIAAAYKGILSDVVEIYQSNPSEVIIPECDYFHFSYFWEDVEHGGGVDLDSLTVIYVEDEEGNRVDKTFTGLGVGYGSRYSYSVYSKKANQYGILVNDKLCLKHGGDCRLSGDETVVCCLTNIVNTGELNNLEKIKIKIYANWYGGKTDVTTGGNMTIRCKAYKSLNETPDFEKDIKVETIEEELDSGVVYHDRYSPNLKNCKEVWSYEANFHVNAYGFTNASCPIECAGEIYSNIGTVSFASNGKNKSFQERDADNGVDLNSGVYNKKYFDDDGNMDGEIKIDKQDTSEHLIKGFYFNYWKQDIFVYTNEEDSINIYLDKDSNTELGLTESYRFIIDSTKLGKEFGVEETKLFSKFKVEKRSDGKLNITFKLIPNVGKNRTIYIEVTKHFETCTPKEIKYNNIYRIRQ